MTMRFQLKCLGEPALTRADGQALRIKVRKHMALLIYLVLEGDRRHQREKLAELLWSNLPEADARHSVATALTSLRAAFGQEVFDANTNGVRWSFAQLDVDLNRLDGGQILGDDVTPPLDVAAFLDGFEVPDAAGFMLWREQQRARWHPRIRDGLVLLMDRCRRTGDSQQIEQLADRMLELDELSEEAVRAKMEARAFAGDRVNALKIFEAWRDRLHEELGAVPSERLEGMALRLRKRGWERTAHHSIASVRIDQWKDRPFIGRGREHLVLYETWERMQRGEEGHAHVLGESGIGKTTLVERLTTAAGLEGASSARVQCYDMEREIPYAAIGGLVRSLLERPGASAASPEALADLAQAVPEVRRRFPNIPPPSDSIGETARLRIAEALHELVTAVADEHPLIVVVDDHHLADDASLALLHHLLRRVKGQQVMLVFIARASELGQSPHAIRLRESLSQCGTVTIELAPMSPDDCDRMVTALTLPAALQPNAATRRALIRAARGYPMVLELLCQDWQERGERSLALSLDAMTPQPDGDSAPTETFRQLYERIAQSLDASTRNVLNLAAILGHRVNDITMYSLADLSLGQTMGGMSRLTELRVLRDGGDGLEFVNEMIRAHAYMGVPSAMRRILHASIAQRLIDSERDGTDILGLEIAWHCIRGGRIEEAVPYLLRGARQALQRGAPHSVELALCSANGVLAQPSDRTAATLLVCESLQEQGEWNRSLIALEEMEPGPDPNQVWLRHALLSAGNSALCRWEEAEVGEMVTEILGAIPNVSDPFTISALARAASGLVLATRHVALAAATLDTLVSFDAVMLKSAARQDWLTAQFRIGCLVREPGALEESSRSLSAEMALTRTRSSSAALLSMGRGGVCCSQGHYEEALTHFDAAIVIATELGNGSLLASAFANRALCYGKLGQYDQQVRSGLESLECDGGQPGNYRRFLAHYTVAIGQAMRGKRVEAINATLALGGVPFERAAQWVQQVRHLYLADCLWLTQKKRAAVRQALKGVTGPLSVPLATGFTGIHARWLARVRPEHDATRSHLFGLLDNIAGLDLFDRAEIALAARFVELEPEAARAFADQAQEALANLPPAVASFFSTLGILPEGRGTARSRAQRAHELRS
jgi:DNA-binding SARP family transcriptional activator/tetratricopeptide (TPR) repeat protein